MCPLARTQTPSGVPGGEGCSAPAAGAKDGSRSGASPRSLIAAGLLVPDLPLEETDVIRAAAGGAGLELVLLTTPTTPLERAKRIAAASQGFVYLVSVAGVPSTNSSGFELPVTSLSTEVPPRLDGHVCAMKQTKMTRSRCDRRGHTVTRNSIFRALSEHTD